MNFENMTREDLIKELQKYQQENSQDKSNEDKNRDRNKYNLLTDESNYLITNIDHSGKLIQLNKTASNYYGYDVEACIGRLAFDFVHPDDQKSTKEIFSKWCREGTVRTSYENRIVSADGETAHILWTSTLHFDKNKKLQWLEGIGRDITKEKMILEELNEAQRLTKIGSWSWDLKNETLNWSDELFRILGFEAQEFTPTYELCLPLYTQSSWELIESSIRKLLEDGEPYYLSLEMIHVDGSVVSTMTKGTAIKSLSGKVVGLHGTVHDITSRKQIECEIRKQKLQLDDSYLELENKNIVLQGLVDEIQKKEDRYKETVSINIAKNIMPLIKSMRDAGSFTEDQLDNLENNVKDISSAFYRRVVALKCNLTQAEQRICKLIKDGFQEKEMAAMLNVSPVTIKSHKKRIRKKLEITNKPIKLKTFLDNLS